MKPQGDSYAPVPWPDFPAAVSAPVAQLDRAPDYESGGREFESLRARHSSQGTKRNQTGSINHAPKHVAQLDRAPDFESGGQGFESLPARHRLCGVRVCNETSVEDRHAADRVIAGVVDPGLRRAGAGPGPARPRAAQGILRALPCDRENRQEPVGAAVSARSAAASISISFPGCSSAASRPAIPTCRNSNSADDARAVSAYLRTTRVRPYSRASDPVQSHDRQL